MAELIERLCDCDCVTVCPNGRTGSQNRCVVMIAEDDYDDDFDDEVTVFQWCLDWILIPSIFVAIAAVAWLVAIVALWASFRLSADIVSLIR